MRTIKRQMRRYGLDLFADAAAQDLEKLFESLRRMSVSSGRRLIRSMPMKSRRRALRLLRSFSKKSAKLRNFIKSI